MHVSRDLIIVTKTFLPRLLLMFIRKQFENISIYGTILPRDTLKAATLGLKWILLKGYGTVVLFIILVLFCR